MGDASIPLIFWNLLLLSLFHALVAIALAAVLKKSQRPLLADSELPPATVVLCIQGNQSDGSDCLRGLLALDYPCYKIQIVIDHCSNPAWQTLPLLLQAHPQVPAECLLAAPHRTCSFECSALIQTVTQLAPDCAVVALIDASLIPPRGWLRALVSPLADPRVGVTTGYRWYWPVKGRWSGLMRYAWNGFMVVQMCLSRVPWEGSLALKTQHIHQIRLTQIWQQTVTPDVMLGRRLRRQGLRVNVVPALLLTSHIGASSQQFVDWVKRRLLLLRVYHPLWLVVAAQGIFVALTLGRATVLVGVMALTQHWLTTGWIVAGLLIYLSVVTSLISILERSARQAAWQRGEPAGRLPLSLLPQLLAVIPLAQLLHAIATISTLFVRSLELQDIAFRVTELRRRLAR
ncbi:MAG: glycosyltransferase [Leptolyngbya sp. SIO4C1]|nr:glycosyltransferase [Leptolyngbya sp. SIO4C1]